MHWTGEETDWTRAWSGLAFVVLAMALRRSRRVREG